MGVLLGGILLFHAGWYMLLPFLAVLLTARRGLSPTEAGLVLGAQSLALLVGSLGGGRLADRVGRRRAMVAGLLLRGVGIAGLGALLLWQPEAVGVGAAPGGLGGLLASAGLIGLGGGLYGPSAKAALTLLAPARQRADAFALRGMAAHTGTGAGPLAGALLLPVPALLFAGAAALHILLGGLTWRLTPEPARSAAPVPEPVPAVGAESLNPSHHPSHYIGQLAHPAFPAFTLLTVLVWALYAQLVIAVPLYARTVLGLERQIGLLFTGSSLAVIALQLPVTRLAQARLTPMTSMAAGALLAGAGLGLVPLATLTPRPFPALLGAVLVFTLGGMLLLPTADRLVALMARPGAEAACFGIATFAWGLGEGLGSAGGGALMQHALAGGRPHLPWALYAAAGLLTAALFTRLKASPLPVPEGGGESVQLLNEEVSLYGEQRSDPLGVQYVHAHDQPDARGVDPRWVSGAEERQ